MKLSQVNYETDKPKKVEITDHNGKSFEPKAFISVISIHSETGTKALHEMQRAMMKLAQENTDVNDISEQQKALKIEAMSKLVIGWEGIEDENGKPMKFNQDNAKIVLSNSYISDIVDKFASNLGNYLTA